jgi:hypothetical protein
MKRRALVFLAVFAGGIAFFADGALAYYHPTLGRWVSRDPVRYEGGPSLYQYVSARPLSRTDPTGRYEEEQHYWDTLVAADKAGFCPRVADAIGRADQGEDENGKDAVTQGILCFLGVGLPFGAAEQYDVHFPGAGPPTLLAPQKPVIAGSAGNSHVHALVEKAKETCAISDIGKAIHSLQDSYAHEGQPDCGGHAKGREITNPETGEKEETTGLLDRRADDPAWDKPLYAQCQSDVAQVMSDIAKKCRCRLCPAGED